MLKGQVFKEQVFENQIFALFVDTFLGRKVLFLSLHSALLCYTPRRTSKGGMQ